MAPTMTKANRHGEPADSDMTLRLDLRMSGDERGDFPEDTIEAERATSLIFAIICWRS